MRTFGLIGALCCLAVIPLYCFAIDLMNIIRQPALRWDLLRYWHHALSNSSLIRPATNPLLLSLSDESLILLFFESSLFSRVLILILRSDWPYSRISGLFGVGGDRLTPTKPLLGIFDNGGPPGFFTSPMIFLLFGGGKTSCVCSR